MVKANTIYCDRCGQYIATVKNPPQGRHVHYKCPPKPPPQSEKQEGTKKFMVAGQ